MPAFPVALGEPGDTADEQVWPKPPPIVAERGDGAVRGDEQRKDIETLQALVAHEMRAGAGRVFDIVRHLVRGPDAPVDQRLSVWSERRAMNEQPRACARGDHPAALVLYVNDPITRNPLVPDVRLGQLLASQRFDRVAPDLREPHAPIDA